MQWANIDTIIRRHLLERGLPIHWYAEFLFHGASCVRELAKDTAVIPINTARLPVNSYYAVDLPADYKDVVAVTIPVGNLLHPVSKKDNITPLRTTDSTGNYVPYGDTELSDGETFFGINTNWDWFWNVNDYGEPTGRYYGAGGGASSNGFKVFKERNQIQLTESFTSEEIVLLYVSNGQSVDNATRIEWDAHRAIQAWIDWQRSPNAALKDAPEARTYYNEKRLLRANLNDLTITDLKDILRKNYTAAIKS